MLLLIHTKHTLYVHCTGYQVYTVLGTWCTLYWVPGVHCTGYQVLGTRCTLYWVPGTGYQVYTVLGTRYWVPGVHCIGYQVLGTRCTLLHWVSGVHCTEYLATLYLAVAGGGQWECGSLKTRPAVSIKEYIIHCTLSESNKIMSLYHCKR